MYSALEEILEQLNKLSAGQEEIKNAMSDGQDQQVADKTNWRQAKRYKRVYKRRPRTN
jgi:ribonuclease D